MKCECCGCEIEGNYIEYEGKFFHRYEDDKCFREWLYDQTDGKCIYGTVKDGNKYEIAPSWTEEYLATLGMSKRDFF